VPGYSQRSQRDPEILSEKNTGAGMWVYGYNPETNDITMIEVKPRNALTKFQTVHLMIYYKQCHDHWDHCVKPQGDYCQVNNIDWKANVIVTDKQIESRSDLIA